MGGSAWPWRGQRRTKCVFLYRFHHHHHHHCHIIIIILRQDLFQDMKQEILASLSDQQVLRIYLSLFANVRVLGTSSHVWLFLHGCLGFELSLPYFHGELSYLLTLPCYPTFPPYPSCKPPSSQQVPFLLPCLFNF